MSLRYPLHKGGLACIRLNTFFDTLRGILPLSFLKKYDIMC